jgi:hypothetical protein
MWYKLAQEYLGNCVNLFDENGDFLLSNLRDASEFEYALEHGININQDEFKLLSDSDKYYDEYIDLPNYGLIIGYNITSDIHDFYRRKYVV